MLATLNEVMAYAEEKKIAVGSFNTPCLESIEAVIAAAEELNVPVIIQHAEGHGRVIALEVIGPAMVAAAKRAKVPVCVHLDHGMTMECMKEAMEMGFTSIMYDGSTLSYDENLKNTRAAVQLAAEFGASVEGELGSMGKRETGAGDTGAGADDDTKIYTDPELAAAFVADTGIDALACSFGTTHGLYLTAPRLDFNVVTGVRARTNNIPVVMHGGSGVSNEDYKKAIEAGVRKINYWTYMNKAGGAAVKEYIDALPEGKVPFFLDAMVSVREAMKKDVMRAMKVFAGVEA